MATPKELYYEKRGQALVKNLQSRHFDACYCKTKEQALNSGNYRALDRDKCRTEAEKLQCAKDAMTADVFLTGANGLSLDGEMVNIDGTGNRVAAIIYGPASVIVVAGMNKVMDTLEAAVERARTVAAPMNKQRFPNVTPCGVTGICADCKNEGCICNHIVITRHCRPVGRIKFILVGEELGF